MKRAFVATAIWVAVTLAVTLLGTLWLLDHASFGQAVVGGMILSLMTTPIMLAPMFRVWTQELLKRRNDAG